MLAMRLSTFFSGAAHILLLRQEWEESTSSSPEFSCSPCFIPPPLALIFFQALLTSDLQAMGEVRAENTTISYSLQVEQLRVFQLNNHLLQVDVSLLSTLYKFIFGF